MGGSGDERTRERRCRRAELIRGASCVQALSRRSDGDRGTQADERRWGSVQTQPERAWLDAVGMTSTAHGQALADIHTHVRPAWRRRARPCAAASTWPETQRVAREDAMAAVAALRHEIAAVAEQ